MWEVWFYSTAEDESPKLFIMGLDDITVARNIADSLMEEGFVYNAWVE